MTSSTTKVLCMIIPGRYLRTFQFTVWLDDMTEGLATVTRDEFQMASLLLARTCARDVPVHSCVRFGLIHLSWLPSPWFGAPWRVGGCDLRESGAPSMSSEGGGKRRTWVPDGGDDDPLGHLRASSAKAALRRRAARSARTASIYTCPAADLEALERGFKTYVSGANAECNKRGVAPNRPASGSGSGHSHGSHTRGTWAGSLQGIQPADDQHAEVVRTQKEDACLRKVNEGSGEVLRDDDNDGERMACETESRHRHRHDSDAALRADEGEGDVDGGEEWLLEDDLHGDVADETGRWEVDHDNNDVGEGAAGSETSKASDSDGDTIISYGDDSPALSAASSPRVGGGARAGDGEDLNASVSYADDDFEEEQDDNEEGREDEAYDEEMEEDAYDTDDFEDVPGVSDEVVLAPKEAVLSPKDARILRASLAELGIGTLRGGASGAQSTPGGSGGTGADDEVIEEAVDMDDDDCSENEADEKEQDSPREMVSDAGVMRGGSGAISAIFRSSRPGSARLGSGRNRAVTSRPLSAVRRKDAVAGETRGRVKSVYDVVPADSPRCALGTSSEVDDLAQAMKAENEKLAAVAVAAKSSEATSVDLIVGHATKPAEKTREQRREEAHDATPSEVETVAAEMTVTAPSVQGNANSATPMEAATVGPDPSTTEGRNLLYQLSDRLSRLDEHKQRYLLRVVGKLERADRAGADLSAIFAGLDNGGAIDVGAGGAAETADEKALEKKQGFEASTSPLRRPVTPRLPPALPSYPPGAVALRVLRTWGSSRSVGLDRVELFAGDGTRIIPSPDSLTLNWLDHPSERVASRAVDDGSSGVGGAGRDGRGLAKLFGGQRGASCNEPAWSVSLPPGQNLGRGVDLVFTPLTGDPVQLAVANLRVWQLNVKETDGRRAGVRTMQVVSPTAIGCDADGVVWSGELSQGTGFEDHAPHVIVNIVPGTEGTVPPLDGGAAREKSAESPPEVLEMGPGRAAATDSVLAVATSVETAEDKGVTSGCNDTPQVEIAAKDIDSYSVAGRKQRVASGRRAGSTSVGSTQGSGQDLLRSNSSLLSSLGVGIPPSGREEAPAAASNACTPADLSGMLVLGTPRVIGRRRGAPLGRPRAVPPMQASWDSLASFSKNQAGRLGSTAVRPTSFAQENLGESGTEGDGDAGEGCCGGGGHGRRASVRQPVTPVEPVADSSLEASSATAVPLDQGRCVSKARTGVVQSDALVEDSLTEMMNLSNQPTSTAAGDAPSGAAAVAAVALLEMEMDNSSAVAETSPGYPDPSWESFIIPERPYGRTLQLLIYTTWGDPHYVGLAGLDIFDAEGTLLTPSDPDTQVCAQPSSVNELEGYSGDPRTVDKLVDGVNLTSDDLHVWLTPFDPSPAAPPVTVTITLDEPATLGMVRIWNYNKSRIHSHRGVRLVEMTLDGARVFCGEVRKAPGVLSEAVAAAECVLFDGSDAFLAAMDLFDAKHYPQTGAFSLEVDDGDLTVGTGAGAPSAVANIAGVHASRGKDGRPVTGVAALQAAGAVPAGGMTIDKSETIEEEGEWAGAMMYDGDDGVMF